MPDERRLRAVNGAAPASPASAPHGTDGRAAGPSPDARAADRERAARLADLMQRTGRGDAQAFDEVYSLMSGSVYGLALRVVRDPHLAEDVAQEALVEVWRTAARFQPERGSARSWVLTIAHRRAVDRVRSEQSQADRAAQAAVEAEHAQAPDEHELVLDSMHLEWRAARVRAGLGTLTALQREAVELAFLKGFTHTEAATALGVPLGTAKARIRDGLIKLRDALGVER